MKKTILISLLVIGIMEGVSWWVYKGFATKKTTEPTKPSEEVQYPTQTATPQSTSVESPQASQNSSQSTGTISPSPADLPPTAMGSPGSEGSFPAPQTEVVNGVTERTIHMGVRQFTWDPKVIRAKEGELVRLVIHNADVKHGIAIPELGVNEDISEDGAVVTLKATKKGTFDFLCSVYCGVGHAEMQGKLIIE